MRDEAEKRTGHLYPKIEVTTEIVRDRPDLKPYVGRKLTVIAWLWARTVKSPNPAFASVDVPLASSFIPLHQERQGGLRRAGHRERRIQIRCQGRRNSGCGKRRHKVVSGC